MGISRIKSQPIKLHLCHPVFKLLHIFNLIGDSLVKHKSQRAGNVHKSYAHVPMRQNKKEPNKGWGWGVRKELLGLLSIFFG